MSGHTHSQGKRYVDPFVNLFPNIIFTCLSSLQIKNDEDELNNILTVQPLQKTTRSKPLPVIQSYALSDNSFHSVDPDGIHWSRYPPTSDLEAESSFVLQPLAPQCPGPYSSPGVFTQSPSSHPLSHPLHPPPPYSSH